MKIEAPRQLHPEAFDTYAEAGIPRQSITPAVERSVDIGADKLVERGEDLSNGYYECSTPFPHKPRTRAVC